MPHPSPPVRPTRVVVADDAAEMRELLRMLLDLEDDFAVVATAADGAEAVRVAEQLQPDLVLLDLSMPVMDGLEALRQLRTSQPGATVVIVSGGASMERVREVRRVGPDDYIDKSDVLPQLLPRLRRLRERGPR